jgi:hypothetical protein
MDRLTVQIRPYPVFISAAILSVSQYYKLVGQWLFVKKMALNVTFFDNPARWFYE